MPSCTSPRTSEQLCAVERSERHTTTRATLFVWAAFRADQHELRPGTSLLVGRASDADLRLDLPFISRHHARFDFDGEILQVTDLGSRNGTWSGGSRITRARLEDGAHVRLGSLLVGTRIFPPSRANAPRLVQLSQVSSRFARDSLPVNDGKQEQGALWIGDEMRAIERTVRGLSPLDVPVLVSGEAGTGKALVARALHDSEARAGTPFRVLHCGAIPVDLVESVLFGHVRGAFAGAHDARGGIFEEAGPGTVFLNEVSELPLPAQAALSRVLESRTVVRVGSTREVTLRARVVAATRCDLSRLVAQGSFREDLLRRLSAVTIDVPPLRRRREEIRPLAEHFMMQALAASGRTQMGLSDNVLALLEAQEWPGNVGQLRDVLLRATAHSQGDVLMVPHTWLGPTREVAPSGLVVEPAETAG